MDNEAGAIVGLVLIAAAIWLAVVIIGAIIYLLAILALAALAAAAFAGPTVAAGYGLRSIFRRYELSPRKKITCALVGATFFALPLLSGLVEPDYLPYGLWVGAALGPTATAVYLAAAGYRQHIWPHRKSLVKAAITGTRMRWRLTKEGFRLAKVSRLVTTSERRNGALIQEWQDLESKMRTFILQKDAAMLSAERLRAESDCANADAVALQDYLLRLNDALGQVRRNDPQEPILILRALVARTHVLQRIVDADASTPYVEASRERSQRESSVAALRNELASLNSLRAGEATAIQQLKRQRNVIQ